MPRFRSSMFALLIGASAIGFVACDEADDSPVASLGVETTAFEAIDREAILNEVDEVRTMLMESGSTIPADSIRDVQFSDRTLRITTSGQLAGLPEAEALCRDVHSALEMSDVAVEVVDASGVLVTSCGTRR